MIFNTFDIKSDYYDDFKWEINNNFTLNDVTDKYTLEQIVKHIGIENIERFIRMQKLKKLKKLSK